MKLLCILLPHFPWQCESQRNPGLVGHPVIVTATAGSQKLLLDCSPELAGLQPEMPLQQALAIQGSVTLIQADMPYYWSVFDAILDQLELKCPLVEGLNLGQAYLGLEGMQLIYPDEELLVKSVKDSIPGTFTVQMGIAEGKFPAYLAALHSSPDGYRALRGDVQAFLKELPCAVLPVSLKSRNNLQDFGIRTLGQVASLPEGPLQSQFGPEGKKIRELAQGRDATPLHPRFFEETVEDSLALSSVTVSLEALAIAVELLLARAFAKFASRGLGIRLINVWTRNWSAEHWEHNIKFKEPAMNVKGAISRIKPVLEKYPQPGPVEQIGLKIIGLGYQSGQQKSLLSEVRAREHLLEDIKSLEQRLGSPLVFKIKEVEPWSRIPERRYALTPLSQ